MKWLKDNSIWVALAVMATLGIYLFFDLKKPVKEPGETPKVEELAGVKADDVTRLEIKKGGKPIILAKSGAVWNLESPAKGKADSEEVKRILDGLLANSSDYQLENPRDLKQYRLDPPEFEVVLTSSGGEKHTLQFGMQDPAKASVYTRDVESKKVFLAANSGVDSLRSKAINDFRDRTLVSTDSDKVTSLTFTRPAGAVKLIKGDQNKWRLTTPWDAPADNTAISGLTSTLASLKGDKFIAAGAQNDPKFGLATPQLTLSVEGAPSGAVRVGKKLAGKGEYYASGAGSTDVLTITEGTFQSLNKTAKDLRSKRIVDFESTDVDQLSITGPKGTWEVQKSGTEWKFVKPEPGQKANAQSIDNVLLDLGAPAAEHIEESSPLIGKYGLDDPLFLTATLTIKDGPKKHLFVGKKTTKSGGRYAMGSDSPNTVFEISKFTFDNINKKHADLK